MRTLCHSPAENWSRFSFCWVMRRSRRLSVTSELVRI